MKPSAARRLFERVAFPPLLLAFAPAALGVDMALGTAAPYPADDGLCALVEAIENANADAAVHGDCPAGSGADAIDLNATVVLDGSLRFPPSAPVFFDGGDSGLPEIVSPITLRNGTLRRDSAFDFRFFVVASGAELRLEGVRLWEGRVVGNCSGSDARGCGGAIAVLGGTLVLENSSIQGSAAEAAAEGDFPSGGAILLRGGSLEARGSRFAGNAARFGGALFLQNATARLFGARFDGNTALTSGGAIYNGFASGLTVIDGVFSDNHVADTTSTFQGGGAIDNAGSSSQLTVVNTQFLGNSAANGGAINNFNASDAYISNATFSGNAATTGGAIANHGSGATLELHSSAVTTNTATRGAGIANGNQQRGIANLVGVSLTGNIASGDGGGIFNLGDLSLAGTTLAGNAGREGGGIHVASGTGQSVAVAGSALRSNVAQFDGGGIHVVENPSSAARNTLTIVDSELEDNEAAAGGGLWGDTVDVTVQRTAFVDNRALGGDGGGAYLRSFIVTGAVVALENSTLSGNTATGGGGGLALAGSAMQAAVTSATFAGNESALASGGDGIHNLADVSAVLVRDSLFAGNGDRNCLDLAPFGVTDGGNNVSSDSTCGFADTGGGVGDAVDPRLSPLAANGGPTPTHALLADSPAVDAGSLGCPPTDQRGAARTGACDIGAFEGAVAPALLAMTVDATELLEADATVATITLTLDNTGLDAQAVEVAVQLTATGTASALGVDYLLENQNGAGETPAGAIPPVVLSAAAGASSSATLTLTTVDDALYELAETVAIGLAYTGNAVLDGPAALLLTIRSDDPDPTPDDLFRDSFETTLAPPE